MHQCLAVFLSLLVLLQSFSREVLVVEFALHQQRITEQYCVNKARPTLGCNGRCHLRKQLAKAGDADKKAPQGPGKAKFEALPLLRHSLVSAARFVETGPRRFRALPAPRPGLEVNRDVFRPPVQG